MEPENRNQSKRRKWKEILVSLVGMLWVLYSGFAYSSPYVSRSLWHAFQYKGVLINLALLFTVIAFWSWLLVMLCVWLCPLRVSRIVLIAWWIVVLFSQCGWIYHILR